MQTFSQTAGRVVAPPRGRLYNGFFYDGRPATGHEALEYNVTPSDVARYESAVGRKAAYVYFSQQWFEGEQFPARTCEWIRKLGKVPYIRLMTWSQAEEGKRERHYTVPAIAAGQFDEAFKKWAVEAGRFGSPVMVEWGIECNARWFPWNGSWYRTSKEAGSAGVTGPACFVAAYRRIITIMRDAGAMNITWVWHINNSDEPEASWNRLENYYPGDDFIDWIGVSDYGARTPFEKNDLPDFRGQMDSVYSRLTSLAPKKPVLISEFACAPGNPHVAADEWALAALADLIGKRWPRVAGFCWWNEIWENDGDRRRDTNMIIMDDPALRRVFKEAFEKAGEKIQEQGVFGE